MMLTDRIICEDSSRQYDGEGPNERLNRSKKKQRNTDSTLIEQHDRVSAAKLGAANSRHCQQ
jgi:hypothetical protein